MGGNHLPSLINLCFKSQNFLFVLRRYVVLFSFHQMEKGKEREDDEEMMIRFSSRKSRRCVALVSMKGLLRHISHCNRVLLTERICRQTDGATVYPKLGTLVFFPSWLESVCW